MKIKLLIIFCVICLTNFYNAQYKDIIIAAENGEAWAQNTMGDAYHDGRNIQQNYSLAYFWYEKAAKHNYGPAQYALGMCYELGHGVAKNDALAFYWYKKAADQNIPRAKREVGIAYLQGKGCEKNKMKAINFLQEACENYDNDACNLLNVTKF